jgi:serine/threonine protein kinase
MGALTWREEKSSGRVDQSESIIEITQDELPSEVKAARTIPTRIFGKFILLEEIGRGGTGIVQKAWDTMLGEYVALKFIREPKSVGGTDSEETRKLRRAQILDLVQEARAALKLRHPNIIPLRDVGETNGQYYISMDYLEGETLADHIRSAQARGRLSALYEDPVFYLTVVRDISKAVHFAHTFPRPIVHCDLKPGNVLISKTRRAFVMDFGLARVLTDPHPSGFVVRGTPVYMAPEQLTGRPEDIDPRTDIYALGGILYELLTGRPMFSGQTPDVLARMRRETPRSPTSVIMATQEGKHTDTTRLLAKATKLEEICLRCLAKKPSARFSTAREGVQELEAVIEALDARDIRQDSMVPGPVRLAVERAELRRVDSRMTSMELESALNEAADLERRRTDTRVRNWLADRRRQVQILDDFRKRLMDRINERRPRFTRLRLVEGVLQDVEFLKASEKTIVVFHGQKSVDLHWSSISLAQLVALAQSVDMNEEQDRLALGIICHHAGLLDLAKGFLESLFGGDLEPYAREILQS